jgi:TRAP-type mannitol/chloroaromatic compound transport system permease small subunit
MSFSDVYLFVIRVIDRITEVVGWVVAFAIAPLILANVYEVVARYGFNRPTTWAVDMTVMSYSAIFMLGAAYALLKGAHIRTDLIWDSFSDRTKGLIDAVAYLLLFLPVMAVLFYISWDSFVHAYYSGERSTLSLWRPVVWPHRLMIPLAAALLFLQGISELMKSLWAVKTGVLLSQHVKAET